MAATDPARLTRRAGRRFALSLGVAFLMLGGLSCWRGHAVAPCVLGGLGVAFVAAGMLAPDRLSPVHRAWMAMGRGAAKITTPILLGVVYFLVITPIGLLMRLFGRNPLRHRERDDSFWVSMQSGGRSDLDRQF
jgi:hypothetical protein